MEKEPFGGIPYQSHYPNLIAFFSYLAPGKQLSLTSLDMH